MHRIERAIILAAGRGERLRPVTSDTPKPLVKVNRTRILDSIISALHVNGIEQIILVTGYLKEQFEILYGNSQNITLIDNPHYLTCNNISSLYAARDYLENAMIIDGDQIIKNPLILHPDFTQSGYAAAWTDKSTDEWVLELKDNIITKCYRNGANNGWRLFGISRWSFEDGRQLRKDLEDEFIRKQHHDMYWDDIALFCNPDGYKLGIDIIKEDDVTEIDSISELIRIDSKYARYAHEKQD